MYGSKENAVQFPVTKLGGIESSRLVFACDRTGPLPSARGQGCPSSGSGARARRRKNVGARS